MDVLFFTVGSSSLLSTCPNLYQLVIDWLQYGTLVNCMMGTANYSNSVGGVQCLISSSVQYSDLYLLWLSKQVTLEKNSMQSFLRNCLEQPALIITSVSVYPSMTDNNNNINNNILIISNNNQTSYPQLVYETIPWGHTQADVVAFFVSTIILSSSMLLSSCLLVAGLILYYSRLRP